MHQIQQHILSVAIPRSFSICRQELCNSCTSYGMLERLVVEDLRFDVIGGWGWFCWGWGCRGWEEVRERGGGAKKVMDGRRLERGGCEESDGWSRLGRRLLFIAKSGREECSREMTWKAFALL